MATHSSNHGLFKLGIKVLLNSFLVTILTIVITAQSFAMSPTEQLSQIGQSYKTHLRDIRPHLTRTGKAVSKSTAQTAAHQGQALILIMILTGVDLVKQSMELSDLRGEAIDHHALKEHAMEAAEHILASGEIWSSLLGAGVTTGALAKPLGVLQAAIQSSAAKPILKDLISNGIATFALFIGWELGGQLFIEAREMLENEDDYKRAEKLIPVLFNSVRQSFGSESTLARNDWLILQKLFSNVVEILVKNDELRNLWLFNTFRHRIATGEFASLVTSMVTATTIGSSLFPGAGTLGGLMFGLAGGSLSLFIPHEQKSWITERFRDARTGFWKLGREGYGNPMMNTYEVTFRILGERIATNEPAPPLLDIDFNPRSMNQIMSVFFESAFDYDVRLQTAMAMRKEAKKFQNQEAFEKWDKIVLETEHKYQQLLDEMLQPYAQDLEMFERLLEGYGFKELKQDPELLDRYPMLLKISRRYSELVELDTFFRSVLIPSIRQQMNNPTGEKNYFPALQRIYLFGFDEHEVLAL